MFAPRLEFLTQGATTISLFLCHTFRYAQTLSFASPNLARTPKLTLTSALP
jgi:hypothetical protein